MLTTLPIFRGSPPAVDPTFTTVYTIEDGFTAILKTLVLSNPSGSAQNFSLRVIPVGSSADTTGFTDCILRNYPVPTDSKPYTFELQLALTAGDRVQIAGGSGVRCYASGFATDA